VIGGKQAARGRMPRQTELIAMTDGTLRRLLPGPGPGSDKFSGGLVGIVAGSPGYPGAAVLSVGGAVRTRPGMVRYAGVQAAPVLAPALIALNSSAMFAGQALGAASGGAVMAQGGYGPLHWMGLGWMLGALALSLWAARQMARQVARRLPSQARGG
jgi:NAD(P)H-hydrate repair Nnr-like enzyme with NAD(P)H-hydrate dehydratase domain